MNNLDLVTEQNTVKDEKLWHREGVGENEEEEETEEEEKEKEEKERRRRKQEEGKEENLVSPMSWRSTLVESSLQESSAMGSLI